MAMHSVSAELAELALLGVTYAEVEARLDRGLSGDEVYNRRDQAMVGQMVDEARERAHRSARQQALSQGQLVEWRRVAGAWLLVGRDLTPGDIVLVARRDGSTSEELVGEIIRVVGGLTYARAGQL